MGKKSEPAQQKKQKVNMHIRYDSMETEFSSQFIINSTREEIIVNCSPGAITDPQTNQQMLPINTRIAMTPQGAARLVQALSNALQNMQTAAQARKANEKSGSGSLN